MPLRLALVILCLTVACGGSGVLPVDAPTSPGIEDASGQLDRGVDTGDRPGDAAGTPDGPGAEDSAADAAGLLDGRLVEGGSTDAAGTADGSASDASPSTDSHASSDGPPGDGPADSVPGPDTAPAEVGSKLDSPVVGQADAVSSTDLPVAADGNTSPGDGGTAGACTAPGSCDPFLTTSCGTGEVCLPDGNPPRSICTKLYKPTLKEGEDCGSNESDGNCGPGLVCHSFTDSIFLCRRMCPLGLRGFCGPNMHCNGVVGGNAQIETCVGFCVAPYRRCDVYAQDCPKTEDTCRPITDRETQETYNGCQRAGTKGEDTPCSGSSECARGLLCAADLSTGLRSCQRVCNTGGAPTCPSPKTCTGIGPFQIKVCQR